MFVLKFMVICGLKQIEGVLVSRDRMNNGGDINLRVVDFRIGPHKLHAKILDYLFVGFDKDVCP